MTTKKVDYTKKNLLYFDKYTTSSFLPNMQEGILHHSRVTSTPEAGQYLEPDSQKPLKAGLPLVMKLDAWFLIGHFLELEEVFFSIIHYCAVKNHNLFRCSSQDFVQRGIFNHLHANTKCFPKALNRHKN
jgi:hypothetical protein